MGAYYNENDPFAAAWLRELIKRDLIAPGDVDERSIRLVQPDDLRGYGQHHFFAGIGGWSYAARLARWPDDRPIWSGSCPCQPFSNAGKRQGRDDQRHLWPDFFRLIRAVRPAVVVGEQVAAAAGRDWFDGVAADLEGEGYACRAVDVPACAVDAPHIRSRLYWVAVDDALGDGQRAPGEPLRAGWLAAYLADEPLADASGERPGGRPVEPSWDLADWLEAGRIEGADRPSERDGWDGLLGDADSERREERGGAVAVRAEFASLQRADGRNGTFWSDAEWIVCHDGKSRRTQPGVPLLAHGVPSRVAKWRGLGNAIVPQLAAEVLAALMDGP